ncbi:MAG: NlpC/P60 family protein [Actinobacteria bacterium]|nr:NlpC/P60 family protein [Actinomycetota bacterium]
MALVVVLLGAWVGIAPAAPGVGEASADRDATTTTTAAPGTTATTLAGETSGGRPGPTTTTTARPSASVMPSLPVGTSPEILERLRQLQLLSGQISAKQMEVYRAAIELDAIDEDVARTVEEYNRLVLQLEESKQQVDRLQREVATSRQDLALATSTLEQRVVGAYKSDTNALEVLLDTTDMSDFIRRVGLLLNIARGDRARFDQINALRARSERLLDELSPRIYEATTASQALEGQKKLVEAKLAERQAYIDRLQGEIRVLVDQQRKISGEVAPPGFDVGAFLAGDGSEIIKTALRYLGVPYVWGGADPATGFDCSGLVQYVYMQNGVYLPHYSVYQSQLGVEVPADAMLPGDLVFFGSPVHHVGIFMGDDLFIEAPRTGDVVKISVLSERPGISHIRRIVFGTATPESPPAQ